MCDGLGLVLFFWGAGNVENGRGAGCFSGGGIFCRTEMERRIGVLFVSAVAGGTCLTFVCMC